MHRLLARQLKKAGIDPGSDSLVAAHSLEQLLSAVDASYHQAEEYRYLQEQALSVSSREMAELAERVEADRCEQEALLSVATAVAEGRRSDELFQTVAERAGGLFGSCAARVFRIVGDPPHSAEPVGAWGKDVCQGELIPGGVVPLELSEASRRLLLDSDSAHVTLASGKGDPLADHLTSIGIGSVVSRLIHVDGQRWGALTLMFDDDGHEMCMAAAPLERFAALTSVAIANAEARSQLEELATVDPLTGLFSRRVFQARLTAEIGDALESGSHLSLVLIDFDDFKLVNDQLGHQVGDSVLRTVAEYLARRAPEQSTLARLGGDEFAWLLPGFSAITAAELVEDVQAHLPELDGLVHAQTISAGVCDIDRAGGEPAELYRKADGALYAAKRRSPGSCIIYRPDTELPKNVEERRAQLERSRGLQAVRSLARAVDARDPLTHSHSERVADLAAALAERVGWDSARRDALYEAALVHDVGKVGVPDAILRFPGPLTEEERFLVRSHASIGAEIVAELLDEDQVAWVRHHHERWDGGGYPDGLTGMHIPDGARIMAIADAFQAIVSDRSYRRGLGAERAVAEIYAGAGSQFDPELARSFVCLWREGHPLLTTAALAPTSEAPPEKTRARELTSASPGDSGARPAHRSAL